MGSTYGDNNNKYSIKESKGPTLQRLRLITLAILFIHHVYAILGVIKANKPDSLSADLKEKLRAHTEMGLRFLTIWNFIGQMIYIGTEITLAILPTINMKLRILCDKLNWIHFVGIVWPSSVFIPMFFWGFYNYDRELIMPKYADIMLPTHLNHSVHTVIVLLNLVEVIMSQRYEMPDIKLLKMLNPLYMLIYCFVLNFTYLWNGIWIYPVFIHITWPQRIGIYAAVAISTQICLRLGYWLLSLRCQHNTKQLKFK